VLTNARSLLRSDLVGAPGGVQAAAYAVIGVAWAGAFAWSLRAHRRERAAGAPAAVLAVPVREDVLAGRPSAPQD
jgi:hypothetical protein